MSIELPTKSIDCLVLPAEITIKGMFSALE